ncbi:PA2779 family protein [Mariprofundus ferrooxydans]|uniref:PA2779 family protein n=1 Tax=Mariprofundus ferrooxydans TaxID=314344 RepID=UPI000363A11E|nr:PA2779 family protein [Mariprofundus ferrooxydans]
MKRCLNNVVVSLMATLMMVMSIQLPYAHAAMVSTEQILEKQQTDRQRDTVIAFLNRAEVQQELQQQGVSPDEAKLRVASLNNDEVEMLAGKIDALPAGGFVGTLIGAAVFLFVVLLITDILGFTDVFPFVHPAR